MKDLAIFLIQVFILSSILSPIFYLVNQKGYKSGYKSGYTKSLVNQEKGLPHDFILEEQNDGTWKWVKNSKGDFYKTTKKEHEK